MTYVILSQIGGHRLAFPGNGAKSKVQYLVGHGHEYIVIFTSLGGKNGRIYVGVSVRIPTCIQ